MTHSHTIYTQFILETLHWKTNLTQSHTFVSHCIYLIVHKEIFRYSATSILPNLLTRIRLEPYNPLTRIGLQWV